MAGCRTEIAHAVRSFLPFLMERRVGMSEVPAPESPPPPAKSPPVTPTHDPLLDRPVELNIRDDDHFDEVAAHVKALLEKAAALGNREALWRLGRLSEKEAFGPQQKVELEDEEDEEEEEEEGAEEAAPAPEEEDDADDDDEADDDDDDGDYPAAKRYRSE